MFIKREINDFYQIEEMAWSGAVDTLNSIIEADKEEEFMQLLEDVFGMDEEIPDETNVNDFIWFESDFIFEHLGLDENGEIPHEESELEKREESIIEMKSTDDFEVFCDDCETCILDFCKSHAECKEMFEDYWNQTLDMEDIIAEWE